MDAIEQFDHPSWTAAVGSVIGYGLILGLLFVLVFVVPFVVYSQAIA